VLLPCNVTVSREGGDTVVRAMNPAGVMEVLANPEVAAALRRVVERVTS
jgi:hypothetical protein